MEQELGRIASASHGVVTRAELRRAGVTTEEIKQRVRRGTLIREHRGVYRVGHRAPSLEARYLAAVRACGEEALLSGRAAAHLLGLVKGTAPPSEVTAPIKRRVPGVRTHRTRCFADATTWRGIPVTTVARTLVDLAGVLSAERPGARLSRGRRALQNDPRDGRGGPRAATATPGRAEAPRDPARGRPRYAQQARIPVPRAPARGERLLLPETNRPAGGRRVDCRWRELRLTVELDSYRYHHSRHAWEQDRRREREARARGDEFRRYTYGDVFEHPDPMLAELRVLLPRV